MNKVIELETYRETTKDIWTLRRESKDMKPQKAHFMYNDDVERLSGKIILFNGIELVSIQKLREEIHEQREALRNGFDKH